MYPIPTVGSIKLYLENLENYGRCGGGACRSKLIPPDSMVNLIWYDGSGPPIWYDPHVTLDMLAKTTFAISSHLCYKPRPLFNC